MSNQAQESSYDIGQDDTDTVYRYAIYSQASRTVYCDSIFV